MKDFRIADRYRPWWSLQALGTGCLAVALTLGACTDTDSRDESNAASPPPRGVPPAVTMSVYSPCALFLGLIYTTEIVRVDIEPGEPVRTDQGRSLSTLKATSEWTVLARGWLQPLEPRVHVDVDFSYATVYTDSFTPFADAESVRAVLDSEAPVLFTHLAQVDRGQFRQGLFGVGELRPDGSIRLLGPCADRWQASLEAIAARHGRLANAEFLIEALYWGGEWYQEVVEHESFRTPTPHAFNEIPAEDRSLDVFAIPRRERHRFKLVDCIVDLSEAQPGMLRITTHEGVVGTFSSEALPSMVAMMIPVGEGAVMFSYPYEVSAPGPPTTTFDSADFDEHLGCRVSAAADTPGSVRFEVSDLPAGELERLLGLSREQIEDRRSRLFAP